MPTLVHRNHHARAQTQLTDRSGRPAWALHGMVRQVSEHTQVLRLINGGISGSPLLNPARLHVMYGVRAENYLEYAALRGDASDNLPGVAGIGEKSAANLLEAVGSMQAVWADIDHNEGRSLVEALDGWTPSK